MKKEIIDIVKLAAKIYGIEWQVLAAFIEVETGGSGFNTDGKIMIQFEPSWFKKQAPYAPSGLWSLNGVDVQRKEWEAFNCAFGKDKNAAMMSTSIGLGQIMGFHYKRLGYVSVGAMWDDAKSGIDRQVYQIVKFIQTDNKLLNAINSLDWHIIATIYNGAYYREMCKKWGRKEAYDVAMKNAYERYKKMQ